MDRPYRRPWLYPKQKAALFSDSRYSIIEASTKSGKTIGAVVWLAEQAMAGRKGQVFWWIAPVYAQTKIAYRRMKAGLPHDLYKANESELTIQLQSGASLVFRSGEKPDTLYGEDVWAVVIDEASRLREDAWNAVRTTLTATRGPIRIIGNVRGKKNWMYRLARRAQSGEPRMEYHRITADDAVDAGVLDGDEIQDAAATLPEAVFRELYYAEPSDDQGNPFGIEAIEKCLGPVSAEPVAVWGWDLAKYHDWTVGVGLDAAGAVAVFERFQRPWEETVSVIRGLVGGASALIDSTGVGDPIVERLQRTLPNVQGFLFSAASKQRLMEGLAVAIQHGEIRYPEGPLVQELRDFEFTYTRTGVRYGAPDGAHDDCVCGMALAVQMRAQGSPMSWAPVEEEPQTAPGEPVFYEIGGM